MAIKGRPKKGTFPVKQTREEANLQKREYYQRTKIDRLPIRKAYYERIDKSFRRNKQLIDMYGITLDEYNQMFAEQEGKCLICGRHQSEFKNALGVDHDHVTGEIRGLLCTHCNNALGCVNDNIDLLYKLIEYLKINERIQSCQ